jgi:hypothetical protein
MFHVKHSSLVGCNVSISVNHPAGELVDFVQQNPPAGVVDRVCAHNGCEANRTSQSVLFACLAASAVFSVILFWNGFVIPFQNFLV